MESYAGFRLHRIDALRSILSGQRADGPQLCSDTFLGPWERPDLALSKFARAMLDGQPIQVFGQGSMSRDFTFNDDLIEAIVRLIEVVPSSAHHADCDTLSPAAPWRLVNVGGGDPAQSMDYIAELSKALGFGARKEFLPMQDGDVPDTLALADIRETSIDYRLSTPISVGVPAFADRYRGYRNRKEN